MKTKTLFQIFPFLFFSTLLGFDTSIFDTALSYNHTENEIIISNTDSHVVAKLKETHLDYFGVYTLVADDNKPLIHAKLHFYSNGIISEIYDNDYSPLAILTEIKAPQAIFQNENPISYELFSSTYSLMATAKRNLFNTKFKIYPPLDNKTAFFRSSRSILFTDSIWKSKPYDNTSSLDPRLVLFLSAYHIHHEKRFQHISNNAQLTPMNPFFDILLFNENSCSPHPIADMTNAPSISIQSHYSKEDLLNDSSQDEPDIDDK